MELETATRGTQYAAAIAPHQRTKDGRAAYLALTSQFAGVDKWEAELKAKEAIMHTWKWKGQSGYKLELFAAQHRAAYVSMVQCAEHVDYQLPNGHSRVGYLLDAIETSDPRLQAAMESVRSDTGPTGMSSDFEAAVAHLLPSCPVARKKAANKRPSNQISSVETENGDSKAVVGAFGGKVGKGSKTGVQLRYHTKKEYSTLSQEEKEELSEWRISTGQKKPKDSGANTKKKTSKSGNKAIAAAVEKQVAAKFKQIHEEQKQDEELEAFIMSCIEKTSKKPRTETPAKVTTSANSALKSIISRAKNKSDNG